MAGLSRQLKDLVNSIDECADALSAAAAWNGTGEPVAPVLHNAKSGKSRSYIYEFYCYIRVVADLNVKQKCIFVPGQAGYKYNFPKAAASKAGKPLFIVRDMAGKDICQICAGVYIKGLKDVKDHPDISFLKPETKDDPVYSDLFMIMDAKFNSDINKKLPKDEVDVFECVVRRFSLHENEKVKCPIVFNDLNGIEGTNVIFTNGPAHKINDNDCRLSEVNMKEVEFFGPDNRGEGVFNIIE